MQKTLQLTNDINRVPELAEWIEILGEELSLPMPNIFQLNLALEEAMVNVMNYAYPNQKEMPVILEVSANDSEPKEIFFRLIDNGIEFDPTKAEDPDITLSAEERQIGGLGIFLVQQLMKTVEYKRENNQNVLLMTYEIK